MGKRQSRYAEIFAKSEGPSPFVIIGGDPMPEPAPAPLAERLKVLKAVKAKLAEFRRRPGPQEGAGGG